MDSPVKTVLARSPNRIATLRASLFRTEARREATSLMSNALAAWRREVRLVKT